MKKNILAILLLAAVLLSMFSGCASDKEGDKGISGTVPVDVTPEDETSAQFGGGEVDPENEELAEEEGANVDAGMLHAETGRANGIDVSKWQGKIDWQKVKASGMDFAYIRIGYRGENGTIYKDDNADYNIQQAQDAGLLIGVYFFSTATTVSEAEEEAEWTASAIEGYSVSYPVVYDCEGYKKNTSRMHSLSASARTDNAVAFLDTVSEKGYEAMFYAARNDVLTSYYWDISRIASSYKIWIAQYPAVTYPELDKPEYSGAYDAWQYTDKGKVNGVEGNVDMVVSYFTCQKAEPKNSAATPEKAEAPLTNEEKLYTAANDTVTAKELVNLRVTATTKSDVVATLANGETATRIGIGTNGWSKLSYKGQTVYAITSYLTTDLTPVTSTQETDVPSSDDGFSAVNDEVTAKIQVNLRAKPDTDSDIVATLSAGEFVSRVGKSDKGWSKLIYNGQTVYAVSSYLTTEVPAETDAPSTSAPDPDAGFEAVDEQVTAKDATNLRTSPSTTDSEVVYTLPNGEYVQRVGVNPNGWSKLIYNGQTVYAKTSYLTTATYSDDGFAAVDEQVTAKIEVNLRTAPTTEGSEIVYTLKNGEYVHRIGKSADGWSKLEYNGQIVYAMTDYLTTES